MVTENLHDCEQIYFTIEVFFSQEDSVSSRFTPGFFVLIHPTSDYFSISQLKRIPVDESPVLAHLPVRSWHNESAQHYHPHTLW